MVVADSSVVVALIHNYGVTTERLWDRLGAAPDLHAPQIVDLEVVNALRKAVGRSTLRDGEASVALLVFGDLAVVRYPHEPLLERVWELRDNLTAYDASYVALAETLEVPLVTADRAFVRAPGPRCDIELFA